MGGGGLRILPHKSWHVWNFDNREKVRKDEENARREEEEKRFRAEMAEQEVRLHVLRKRAGLEDDEDNREDQYPALQAEAPQEIADVGSEYPALQAPQEIVEVASSNRKAEHINFFADAEVAYKKQEHKRVSSSLPKICISECTNY
eukprot:m.92279 g.92279  ORF g.92279 m.92279 type:complete len:146 (-) comp13343_c0_seq3:632-1069(-)